MKPLFIFIPAMLCGLLATAQLKLVKQINPYTEGSYPQIVGGLSNGRILFFAWDNVSAKDVTLGTGFKELWISDGTEKGTTLVKDIHPGINGSVGDITSVLYNDLLYFVANNGKSDNLYVSEGRFATTYPLLTDIPEYKIAFTGYNGKVYFAYNHPQLGRELHVTDGTPGSVQVVDLRPGAGSSAPAYLYPAFGKMLFVATDSLAGREVHITDGTLQGTKLLGDVNPGTGAGVDIYETNFCASNGKVFYAGTSSENEGIELYATDGNTIWLVKDIDTTKGKSSKPRLLTAVGNKVYFGAEHPAYGYELWVSDGTEQGTRLVRDITPGTTGTQLFLHGEIDGKLIFAANTTNYGLELWITDGTATGTRMIKDICPGDCTGTAITQSEKATWARAATSIVIHNDKFYFGGYDGSGDGIQLWVTDGTDTGTRKIPSMLPDPGFPTGPALDWMTIFRDKIWMSYAHGAHDYELYTYDLNPTGIADNIIDSRSFTLSPNPTSGRFVIDLDNNSFTSADMQVLDMTTGRVVYSQVVGQGVRNVPVQLQHVPRCGYLPVRGRGPAPGPGAAAWGPSARRR